MAASVQPWLPGLGAALRWRPLVLQRSASGLRDLAARRQRVWNVAIDVVPTLLMIGLPTTPHTKRIKVVKIFAPILEEKAIPIHVLGHFAPVEPGQVCML